MNIENLQFKIKDEKAILSADIYDGKKLISEVFLRVDKKYAEFIRKDATPFTPIAYIAASKKGKPLTIAGGISPLLKDNLPKIGDIIKNWNLGFKPITVIAEIVNTVGNGNNVGSFFSGGADSFYTYLKHRNDINDKISHLLFVHGFDISLNNRPLFEMTHEHLETIAKKEQKELIIIETNIRDFLDKYMGWEWSHGAALGSVAQFLGEGFRKIYVPGTADTDNIFPLGSHPDVDPLWSSEKTNILYDGLEARRFDKIKLIAESEIGLSHLRVCYSNYGNSFNCSKCNKCLRTMVHLEAVNALTRSKTFILPLDIRAVSRINDMPNRELRHYKVALAELSRSERNHELQKAIKQVVINIEDPGIYKKVKGLCENIDHSIAGGRILKYLWMLKKRLSNFKFAYYEN